jgi:hypothetical protein
MMLILYACMVRKFIEKRASITIGVIYIVAELRRGKKAIPKHGKIELCR